MSPSEVRFEAGPLFRVTGADSADALATMLHVHRRQVQRASAEGITGTKADRWAVQLGYLPWELWPDWCEWADLWVDEVEQRREQARAGRRERDRGYANARRQRQRRVDA